MVYADTTQLFYFSYPRSFITCTRAMCIFRGVEACGNAESVSSHLISAPRARMLN